MEVRGQLLGVCSLPSAVWVHNIELMSSGLLANAFIC